MLWELRAEPLGISPGFVVVELKQVPGYSDFLAEIMRPEVSTWQGFVWWHRAAICIPPRVVLTPSSVVSADVVFGVFSTTTTCTLYRLQELERIFTPTKFFL